MSFLRPKQMQGKREDQNKNKIEAKIEDEDKFFGVIYLYLQCVRNDFFQRQFCCQYLLKLV